MSDLLADIAPAQAMQITVSGHWKNGIELAAPLAANINDKGTAFAGSISSMLTLAGWALITHLLNEAGIQAEVMVVESSTTYSAAVRADLKSSPKFQPKKWPAFSKNWKSAAAAGSTSKAPSSAMRK